MPYVSYEQRRVPMTYIFCAVVLASSGKGTTHPLMSHHITSCHITSHHITYYHTLLSNPLISSYISNPPSSPLCLVSSTTLPINVPERFDTYQTGRALMNYNVSDRSDPKVVPPFINTTSMNAAAQTYFNQPVATADQVPHTPSHHPSSHYTPFDAQFSRTTPSHTAHFHTTTIATLTTTLRRHPYCHHRRHG